MLLDLQGTVASDAVSLQVFPRCYSKAVPADQGTSDKVRTRIQLQEVGGGWGHCSAPPSAQDSPTTENYLAQNVNSAQFEQPSPQLAQGLGSGWQEGSQPCRACLPRWEGRAALGVPGGHTGLLGHRGTGMGCRAGRRPVSTSDHPLQPFDRGGNSHRSWVTCARAHGQTDWPGVQCARVPSTSHSPSPRPRTTAWRCVACAKTRWRACSSCCSSPFCPLGPWPPPSAACPEPGPSSHPGQQGREGRVLGEGTGGSTQGHCWGGCGLLMGPHPASLPLPTSYPSDDYEDTDDDDPFNPQVQTLA